MRRRRASDAQLVQRAIELGDPAAALVAIGELRRRLDALEAAHVDDALRAGWSWQSIGIALGITRQAAHSRHARRRRGDDRVAVAGRARIVLERARQEAARFGSPTTETDHLLLGLVLEADGPVAEAIAACRLDEEEIRIRLESERRGVGRQARIPAFSQSSLAVLEDALREAMQRGSDKLACDHLLLALMREPGGRGQRLVMALGKTPRAVERRLNRACEKHAARRDRAAGAEAHAQTALTAI